jgi:hypothetical protein
VYYGDPDVPNITTTPSFIKVSDYSSTRSLADHLRFLDANPDEYARYQAWRKSKTPFTREYLNDLAENYPGPAEVAMNIAHVSRFLSNRKAVCCRLCDEAFLFRKMAVHSERNRVPHSQGREKSLKILHEMGKGI